MEKELNYLSGRVVDIESELLYFEQTKGIDEESNSEYWNRLIDKANKELELLDNIITAITIFELNN